MAFRRALVVGAWAVHEFVSNRCRQDVRTRKRGVHGARCEARLGEGVATVVRCVIVAIVVRLAGWYVPPSRLVGGRAATAAGPRPRDEKRVDGTLAGVLKTLGLSLQQP